MIYNHHSSVYSVLAVCCLTWWTNFCAFAQIQTPSLPPFDNNQPVVIQPTYSNSNLHPKPNTPSQHYSPPVKIGGTANDIINRQHHHTANSVSAPAYAPGMTPQQRQQANMKFIQQQMANDPAYSMPNSNNNFNQATLQRDKELLSILNEISHIKKQVNRNEYYTSQKFKSDLENYQNAFNYLKDMLEGKIPLLLADAYYIAEEAYGNLHLTYDEYKKLIKQSADFIKQWMLENKLNNKNPEHIHLAIQKFMGDTLYLKNNNPDMVGGLSLSTAHVPFFYDYIDYQAEKDLHNYFLTKTLATGTGQCHTLPNVYAVLAEAMGVEASISFVHQHSFIKYRNNDGTIQNYEPTIDWHMSDNDYTEDLPVMSAAIANKIYLHPLTKQQNVASIIIDMVYSFYREHWTADGKFMNQSLDYAMQYFHNNEGHREGLLLKNMVLASQLEHILRRHGISDLKDIDVVPEAAKAYQAYRKSSDRIRELGIQHYPDVVYNAMLEKNDIRGKLQIAKGIDTKSKKSLFFNFSNKQP